MIYIHPICSIKTDLVKIDKNLQLLVHIEYKDNFWYTLSTYYSMIAHKKTIYNLFQCILRG